MKTVFISSIQREFGDIRLAARNAVESMGMHAVMAETTGASPASPRRALLDEVRDADIFLLLLGPRYGESGDSRRSPTEDEYNEAVRLDKPILVLRQNVAMEPEQEAFLARTRGSWEEGKLSGSFDDAADAGLQIVKALRRYEARLAATADADLAPRAQERAAELARADDRFGTMSSGSKARFVAVPVVAGVVLDAVALDDGGLPDALQMLARSGGLVSNAMGLNAQVSADGIRFEAKDDNEWETLRFLVGADGAIVAEGTVAGRSGHFASSVIMADRLATFVDRAQRFALNVWGRIDPNHDIREAALSLSIPNADHKVFTDTEPGSSMSVPMGLPNVVVAPEPARLVRREDIAGEGTSRMLFAELKRRFADANAVH
jgi:hypothetical protein